MEYFSSNAIIPVLLSITVMPAFNLVVVIEDLVGYCFIVLPKVPLKSRWEYKYTNVLIEIEAVKY